MPSQSRVFRIPTCYANPPASDSTSSTKKNCTLKVVIIRIRRVGLKEKSHCIEQNNVIPKTML
jgi:hypothetical protein